GDIVDFKYDYDAYTINNIFELHRDDLDSVINFFEYPVSNKVMLAQAICLFEMLDVVETRAEIEIVTYYLEVFMATLLVSAKPGVGCTPQHIDYYTFGLHKLPDLDHCFVFTGIVGNSEIQLVTPGKKQTDLHILPIVDLLTHVLPHKNLIKNFKGICEIYCAKHEYVRTWLLLLVRATFLGVYPWSHNTMGLQKRFEYMHEIHPNNSEFITMLVSQYPNIVMFCIKEYVMLSLSQNRCLYGVVTNYHLDWATFEKVVLETCNHLRSMLASTNDFIQIDEFLNGVVYEQKTTIFRNYTGWFWEYMVDIFKDIPEINAKRLQNQNDPEYNPKLFDVRYAYNNVDAVLQAAMDIGYSKPALQLVREISILHSTNASKCIVKKSISKRSLEHRVEAFMCCVVVVDIFRLRQIDMPWHWFLHHKQANDSMRVFGDLDQSRVDRGRSYICTTCNTFKSYMIYSDEEFEWVSQMKKKKKKKKGKTQRPDTAVFALGYYKTRYDIATQKVYCNVKIPGGRREDIAYQTKLRNMVSAQTPKDEILDFVNRSTFKKRKKNDEMRIFPSNTSCNSTVLVPVITRGTMVEYNGTLMSSCFKCGGMCHVNILRNCSGDVFKCTQCDLTTQPEFCEVCRSVKKPTSKAVWRSAMCVDHPTKLGGTMIWTCKKCIKPWMGGKRVWNYHILIKELREARKTKLSKKHNVVSTS
ncbi:MAG: hypothetical protein ACTSUE_06095, partial [Promethearchaeota archaeon]